MKSREGSRVKHWVGFTLLAQLLLILVGFWVGIRVGILPQIGDVTFHGPDATSLPLPTSLYVKITSALLAPIRLGTTPTPCLPAKVKRYSSVPNIWTDYQFQFPSIRTVSSFHSIWTDYSFHSFQTNTQLLLLSSNCDSSSNSIIIMSLMNPPPVVAAPTVADITIRIRMRRILNIKVLKWFHSSFNAVYGLEIKEGTLEPLLSTDRLSFKSDAVTDIRELTVAQYQALATSSDAQGLALIGTYVRNTALLYKTASGGYRPLRTGAQLTETATAALSTDAPVVDIAFEQSSLFPKINLPTIDFTDFGQFTMNYNDVALEDDDSDDEQPAALINIQEPGSASA